MGWFGVHVPVNWEFILVSFTLIGEQDRITWFALSLRCIRNRVVSHSHTSVMLATKGFPCELC
jgi:hypothetical protein